jgi:hypothetical protein
LSARLGFTTKWISTSLRRLRDDGLIEFDLRERQRRAFRITEGPALRVFRSDFRSDLRRQARTGAGVEGDHERSDFRSVLRSREGVFRSGDLPQAQAQSAFATPSSEGTSAGAETETETTPAGNDHVGTTSEVDAAHTREDTTDNEAFLAGVRSLQDERENKPSPFQAPALVAHRVGDEGFIRFVRALGRLGVLNGDEVRAWHSLHGATMRAALPPLDAGDGIPDAELGALVQSIPGASLVVEQSA